MQHDVGRARHVPGWLVLSVLQPRENLVMSTTFDAIIIGTGKAGPVLTARRAARGARAAV